MGNDLYPNIEEELMAALSDDLAKEIDAVFLEEANELWQLEAGTRRGLVPDVGVGSEVPLMDFQITKTPVEPISHTRKLQTYWEVDHLQELQTIKDIQSTENRNAYKRAMKGILK